MSGGAITCRLHSSAASGSLCDLITGLMPDLRSAYCSTMLCIEYQNGTAICLPPRSANDLMPVSAPTTTPEPLVCAQAMILTGKWLL